MCQIVQGITVEKILLEFEPKPKNILPALKKINASFGWLEKNNLQKTGEYFGIPLAEIFETATFYDLLQTKKPRPLEIKICSGANCATKAAYRVLEEIEKILNIRAEDDFNPKVKLEVASCLGRCGDGPIMIINGTVFTKVKPREVHSLLAGYL